MQTSPSLWQDIAWNGVCLQLPFNWQTAVIDRSYLFFEQNGEPAFAIRWENISGRFSADRILRRMRKSLKHPSSALAPWDMQAELQERCQKYSLTAYQWHDEGKAGKGLLLYCPLCHRATLMQLYGSDPAGGRIVNHVLDTYSDHPSGREQQWSMYDIRALLPISAELQSHEFLAGRFTLSFAVNSTRIHLYRFKPAAAILQNQSLRDFGHTLADGADYLEGESDVEADWEYCAAGLQRVAVLLGRKPGWIWLRLRELKEHNAILAVKGTGKNARDRKLLEHVAENFVVRNFS